MGTIKRAACALLTLALCAGLAGCATDGGGGERFTAAPTADGDDAPTGDSGLANGSTASI